MAISANARIEDTNVLKIGVANVRQPGAAAQTGFATGIVGVAAKAPGRVGDDVGALPAGSPIKGPLVMSLIAMPPAKLEERAAIFAPALAHGRGLNERSSLGYPQAGGWALAG